MKRSKTRWALSRLLPAKSISSIRCPSLLHFSTLKVAAVRIEWIVSFLRGPVVVGHLRTCSKSEQRKSRIVHCSATSEMPTLFYIFAISFAGVFLYVAVNRFEPNRPLAILLMILLVGITAAAVLHHLMP